MVSHLDGAAGLRCGRMWKKVVQMQFLRFLTVGRAAKLLSDIIRFTKTMQNCFCAEIAEWRSLCGPTLTNIIGAPTAVEAIGIVRREERFEFIGANPQTVSLF